MGNSRRAHLALTTINRAMVKILSDEMSLGDDTGDSGKETETVARIEQERHRVARIEQGKRQWLVDRAGRKRQSGTYRAGKETKSETEWHV
ncbi:hypothetical protein RRG08_000776 [Elysia crispata]|uniref:Uncharacterized protein n=1 Tax=Elysia crispata TaxID=231223 RepID=A0AAE0ZXC7_9GAST|nr:hypothetical protein RRG08_000776 [Elysia crispata]